jgi:PAS domain S-box-containing protein
VPAGTKNTKQIRLPLYLVPIVIGLAGVLFSRQFQDPWWRGFLLLFSLSFPILASGYLMALLRGRLRERIFIMAGIFLLLIGAVASVLHSYDPVVEQELSHGVEDFARWLGTISLLVGLLVTVVSIVRSGEAADELAGRFRNLVEQMSEGVVIADTKGKILLINEQFLDLSGLSREQAIGQNIQHLAEDLHLEPILWHWRQRIKGVASEYEITYNRKGDERRLWISGAPLYDRYGDNAGTLATIRDITEQHRMSRRLERYTQGLQKLVEEQTEKLRASQQRFRDLLLHMSEGFLTLDATFRIRFSNERIREILQVPKDSVSGREIFDFVDPRGRTRLLDALESAQHRRSVRVQQEVNFMRADGGSIPAVVAIALVQEGSDSEGSRYSLVITDVSDLKRMQRQMEERARELERVNEELRAHGRAKDGFLSNVSHELRTPLSTIQGYVEMLESTNLGSLAGPQKGALDIMSRNVERLGALINEMIEFSRMEIRGVQVKLRLFDVEKLVREAAASIRPNVLAKDISLSSHVDDALGPVWGDRQKIGQVLAIFLSNAVKFSPNGAMIQVRATLSQEGEVALSVTDTGIGIPRPYQERIFSKFFQIDSSLTRRYEGTGIGLSIAKSIAEAHGGRIELESLPGKGSTFTLVLPQAAFASRISPEHAAVLQDRRILIADESHDFRTTIAGLLECCGASVEHTRHGYECIRKAEEKSVDVALVDETLPDVTAVAVVARLRENPATEDVPVVVSYEGRESDFEKEGGVPRNVWLLKKPFSAEALAAALRQALEHEAQSLLRMPEAAPVPQEGVRVRESEGPVVLLLGPDEDLLEWLETALAHRKVNCMRMTNVEEAVRRAAERRLTAVLIDVEAAESPYAQVAQRIRMIKQNEDVPIYGMTGLAAGVNSLGALTGVLTKPFTIQDVMDAVFARPHTVA